MMTCLKFKCSLLGVVCILMSACATSPIAEQYRLEAREDNLLFPMALRNPDAHVGDSVVWGGKIIETKNLKNKTRIIVMETTLGDETEPLDPRHSKGRFIAESPDFLDPELYKKGEKVTVAGVIAGKQKMPIDETTYTYPVVTIKQIHLWEEEKEPEYRYYYPYGYWGWGPHWRFGGGYNGP